jgi:hypothetical protein
MNLIVKPFDIGKAGSFWNIFCLEKSRQFLVQANIF